MKSFEEMLGEEDENEFRPETQYDHAYALLQKDRSKKFKAFRDLHSKNILLGNIQNDKIMLLLQTDVAILTQLFDMGLRDEQTIMPIFDMLWSTLINQINLTRAQGGLERKLQVFSQPDISGVRGFGQQLQEEMARREQENQGKFGGLDYA